MKDYEKYTAAQPIADVLSEHDADALDLESEALLERVVAEFGDVRTGEDSRPFGTIAGGELFAQEPVRSARSRRISTPLTSMGRHSS